MPYATPNEVRLFCGLSEAELPDAEAEAALELAKGIIDHYCRCTFEEPETASVYVYPRESGNVILAPADDGPFHPDGIVSVEVWDGEQWVQYDGRIFIPPHGEWMELEDLVLHSARVRVTAKCWRRLDGRGLARLQRLTLLLCRWVLVPRDEPWGPSIRAVSFEGISYSYQPVNEEHPTGNHEIDQLLRSFRRQVVRT
jgi:hypothetical protein